MPNRNVTIPEHFDRFIAAGIRSGRFFDATDAILEGLRLLEQHEMRAPLLERLQEVSGLPPAELDVTDGIEFESVSDFLELLVQLGPEPPSLSVS